MKVLFVHSGGENLGVERLSSWLKSRGHETALLFDPATFSGTENARLGFLAKGLNKTQAIVDSAVAMKPDLIGFSVFTVNYRWALDVASKIKARIDVPIVFGGVHASAVPARVMANSVIDAVVVGEGEEALVELVEGIRNGKLPKGPIANVWLRDENGVAGSPPRPYLRELDTAPFPDKDLFYAKVPALADHYMIMTSRGCPYRCAFCCNSLYHDLYKGERGGVRRIGADRIVEELEWATGSYKVSFVSFWDDVFTADIKWLRRFGELYKKIGLPYDVYTHPLAIDAERADILANTGCYRVKIGLQTTSEKTRKYLDRSGTTAQVEEAAKILKERGITVGVDHMLGLPGEGVAEQEDAAAFYARVRPDRINSYWMLYFPGAKVVERALESGLITAKQVEEIEEGLSETSYMYLDPAVKDGRAEMTSYQTFFDLLPLLPAPIANYILKKHLVGKLPYNPILRQTIVGLAALFQKDKRYRNTLKVMFSKKNIP